MTDSKNINFDKFSRSFEQVYDTIIYLIPVNNDKSL